MFEGEIYFSANVDAVEGVLVCRIQAGNLSKSVLKWVPVRITTAHVSTFDRVHALVETLSGRSKSQIERTSGQSS